MKKVYVILNRYSNSLDYEDSIDGIAYIAVCRSLNAAINYLRNYEDILKKMSGAKWQDDDAIPREYDRIKFEEDGINSKFFFDTYEYGIVTNCLFIEEAELIGEP